MKKFITPVIIAITVSITILASYFYYINNNVAKYEKQIGEQKQENEIQKLELDKIILLFKAEKEQNSVLLKQLEISKNKLQASENQLKVYEQSISCMQMIVYLDNPAYGAFAVGDTELCGYKIHLNEKVWGPSMEAFIDDLKKENLELKQKLEEKK